MTNAEFSRVPLKPLLDIKGISKRFGALKVTDDVTLQVSAGELHAIIGPNGAGKTTLINQISGVLKPDSGQVVFDGVDVTPLKVQHRARAGLLRSFQITSVFERFTALENATLAALGTRDHAFGFWKPLMERKSLVEVARQALQDTGLASQAGIAVEELSYGERRQLELAMALAAKPKFLLLDEPMAGMSPQESGVVVELLRTLKQRYGILLIEHDMDAVFALADTISVLVNGRIIVQGTPDEIRDNPEVRAVYLGEEDASGQELSR
jgi:branched-chain amino acid transport system ATP-binding protein